MGAAHPTIAITVGVILVLAIAVPAAIVLLFRNGWRVLPLAIGMIAGLIVGAALGELHWSGLAPRLGTLEHNFAGLEQKLDAIKLAERLQKLEAAVAQGPSKDDLKQFPTKDDVKVLPTKEDLRQLPTREDLRQLPTKADLGQFATKEDLKQLPLKGDLGKFATKEGFEQLPTKDDLNKAGNAIVDKLKPPPMPTAPPPVPPPKPPDPDQLEPDIVIDKARPAWLNGRPVVWVTLKARSGAPARLIDGGDINFCPANGATLRQDGCSPARPNKKCKGTFTCSRMIGPGPSPELCATITGPFAQNRDLGFTIRGELRLTDGAGKPFDIPLEYGTPLTATAPPPGAQLNLGRNSGCK